MFWAALLFDPDEYSIFIIIYVMLIYIYIYI